KSHAWPFPHLSSPYLQHIFELMSKPVIAISPANAASLSDYSLVGKDTALAIQKGLAEATWYTSPVPREKLRELLERRDGPAIRDTLLWFALILGSGVCGFMLWGISW